jgi:hypothetical protein
VGEVLGMIHSYDVIRPFEAVAPISGRKRRFEPGDVVIYDPSDSGPTVLIEADMSLFSVDSMTLKTCCKYKDQGGSVF